MTTPDPTPYLLPTDLRTAEDVLAWQADCVLAWVPEHSDGRMPAGSLVQLLAARLERERRQACRRGALLDWRRVCELVRWCDAYRNSDAAWHEVAPSLWRALTRALAFRAAARAK